MYKVINSRLEELNLIGISHNDLRAAIIHVSFSGGISLIDFGLSDCTNNEELKNNFKTPDYILRAHGSNDNYKQFNRGSTKSEVVLANRANGNEKYENASNTSSEDIFYEWILKTWLLEK